MHRECVIVNHVNAVDYRNRASGYNGILGIKDEIQTELDCIGVYSGPIMEFDAVLQVKGDGPLIITDGE